MLQGLSSLVTKRPGVVGFELQVIWQKTLTSSHSLKQALSSPDSANLPATKPNDGPSQESFLPIFDAAEFNTLDPFSHDADHVRSSSEPNIAKVLSVAESFKSTMGGPTTTTQHATSQTEVSRTIAADRGSMTYHSTRKYANAVTQTEPSPPGLISTLENADDWNHAELDGLSNTGSGAASPVEDNLDADSYGHNGNFSRPIEVPRGPTCLVMTKLDSEERPALLVTKEVIWRMEGIREATKKVNRRHTKVDRLEREVGLHRINVEYQEDLLEDATSQDEADKIREIIADLRSKMSPNEKRLAALKDRQVTSREDLDYLMGCLQDKFERVLIDNGLLKNSEEQIDNETSDHDDLPENQPELEPDQITISSIQSDTSDISLEELHWRTIGEELRARHLELVEVEHNFEMRHDHYDETKARYLAMVSGGQIEMTPTEFDNYDVQCTRELTQDLRRADEAYEEALGRRNALGPNEEDQESGFLDDQDDGYRLSFEQDGPASAPTKFILKWLEGIPDADNLPDMETLELVPSSRCQRAYEEGLEDCDIRSAQMSDGWSCHDWSRNRRRIDRWRAIAGRDR
ncbi:MAG: hypothetical protein Q9168_000495 [Polycauliona sp. 1 TL-2023]